MFKKIIVGVIVAVSLGGCARDADVASRNLSQAADNFQIERRIVFYNGITDTYVLSIEGKCAFNVVSENKVDVTCKVGDGDYKKHSLGISDNVTYFSEQTESKGVSVYHYKVDFKPQLVLRDIDLKVSTDSKELPKLD